MVDNLLVQERRRLRDAMKQQYMKEIYHPDFATTGHGVKVDGDSTMEAAASIAEAFKPKSSCALKHYILTMCSTNTSAGFREAGQRRSHKADTGVKARFCKFDPAVQRFMAMRASAYDHFKPSSPRSLFFLFGAYIFPIVGGYLLVKRDIERKEHMLSTGQVSYRDRNHKFHH